MSSEVRDLHRTLVDLVGLMNQPQRDRALLQEAGVALDRALFPLLVAIERRGPVGVVELSELVGRDYTTVSRQVSKMARLGVIRRRPSRSDRRVREAVIEAPGRKMTRALDAARERMARTMFARWSARDRKELARLMRRFVRDLASGPPLPVARP
jgi:DNA-binding MarR family transcriptional regulator